MTALELPFQCGMHVHKVPFHAVVCNVTKIQNKTGKEPFYVNCTNSMVGRFYILKKMNKSEL